MTRTLLATTLTLLAITLPGHGEGPESFDYRVTEVTRTLERIAEPEPAPLTTGDLAHSGDLLRTGRRSSAELVVEERGARFRLGAKTRVRLAHEVPGALLEVEQGRLRALFAPVLDGDAPERLVTTPTAILAVRGTEYGITVARNGDTELVVFEGVVEVADRGDLGPPVRVAAGETSRIRHQQPATEPRPHRLSPGDFDRGRRVNEPPGLGRSGAGPSDPGAGPGGVMPQPGGGSGGSRRHGG